MSQSALESKVDRVVQAEQDIINKRRENRQKDEFVDQFGDATIQDVINDEDKLDDNEFVKFKLLMPDNETVRYLSFSEEQVNGRTFDNFLDYLDTTEHSMNVLYKTIPVTYASGQWKTSFLTRFFPKQTRKGRFFSIGGSDGMFILTRWSYLTLTAISGLMSAMLYQFGYIESIQFVWLVSFSLIFAPLMIPYFGMDSLYTGLMSLSED